MTWLLTGNLGFKQRQNGSESTLVGLDRDLLSCSPFGCQGTGQEGSHCRHPGDQPKVLIFDNHGGA